MALPSLVLSRGPLDFHSQLPVALITGTGSDPRPRLRVDQAQTSFFENREFRTYHEFNISAGASVWLRWTLPVDINVHGRDITVVQGQLRYALYTSVGTPGGTWTAKPMFRVNNYASAPVYTRRTTVDVGGTYTGGVESDLMLANAGTGGNSATANVGIVEGSLVAGTYYVELRCVGAQACVGMYRVNFEEYAASASIIQLP